MEHLRLLPEIIQMGCGPLQSTLLSPRRAVDILKRSMRPQPCSGWTLSLIMSPEDQTPRTQIRLGVLAQDPFARGLLGR